ncbi:MAG: tRNA uridine(34) 5-carboxymethylaminomethyl modification radical SAM/GNAT enzyme Elp3 [Candidatus Nealsonbacteria bacterium CG15_BIG_FIL_POST_REV_8_21_14_020_37_12]|uniref:tRNA carboxymethyluridine synthase n=3 Tax=Candidatus Nealsoniibacteriota TaxID=1817911 RepID=A0A2M7H0Y0_9BACT|nr:MAG: tRNA uridine(34) 5-carboxymethylaminomethyl modification radical SAM/GNAT enzyme Elp3 [Candidatus Nealsonbacteria bacterium CG15_BIG_FIL_POST_REV_8_21_14_020_37_12]
MKLNELVIKDLIKSQIKTPADLAFFKRKVSKKYKIPCPSNIELLKVYHKLVKNKRIKKSEKLEDLLRTRPIRSLSGIVNISVLTKPYPCPGKCLYCPTEKGIPKSYVSGEPAVERAKRLNYNPYLQVKKRIEMLENEGHPTDKIELRIVGGTWSYYPKDYQSWFITSCFAACNTELRRTIRRTTLKDLEKTQKLNEKAKHRIVGLSIETRPDFINVEEIKWLRKLGITMVELGVQSIYDDVLKLNLRGHGVKETILATKLLKDAGFKVLYQMMPNLPGSNLKRDEKMFEELFQNPDFQPDLLKIYPCALLKEAPLYKWWKAGKYKPYTEKQLINLIKSIKQKIPYYVRIQRITRDIPSRSIVTGPAKISNLRQILAEKMEKEGWRCKCIRCREVRENYDPKEKIYLFREDYEASRGKEIFLSFENKNRTKLYSLLRLRITSKNKAIIREVHTYGPLVPIGVKKLSPQHRGLGKKLIKEAEKITKKEFGLNKIAVISGVGVRDYFKRLGYKLRDTYMIKIL